MGRFDPGECHVFRSVVAATCLAFVLSASEAVAEPFDQFVDFCVRTNAERDVVAGAVKGAGWFALPAQEIFAEDDEFRDPALYISEDPSGFSEKGPPADLGMIMTGWGDGEEIFDIPGVKMDACVVLVSNVSPDELRQRLRDLLGFNSVAMDDEDRWIFSRQGDAFSSEHEHIDVDDAQVPELVRRKKLYIAGVMVEDNFVGVIMAALRPNE